MTVLYLVRHGRTQLNKEKVFRGMFDVPLDEVGKAEGRSVAQALAGEQIARIYSSPLSRAQLTAKYLSLAAGAPVETAEAFRDIDYGLWTGRKDDEVRRDYERLYEQWQSSPGKVRFPEGEGLADVRKRVASPLAAIAEKGGAAAIVSHRVTLKVILCVLLDLDDRSFTRFQLDTASWSRLDYDANWRLTTLNQCSHLKSVEGHLEAEDF